MEPWISERIGAIQICMDAEFVEAALALLYSAIDTLAFLAAPSGTEDVARGNFIEWCDRYMSPRLRGVSGIDLYGARGGILHTSSAASRLGRVGRAREVWYRFKGQTGVNLVTNTPEPAIILDIEQLIAAFGEATREFVRDVRADRDRLATAQERVRQFFSWGVLHGDIFDL